MWYQKWRYLWVSFLGSTRVTTPRRSSTAFTSLWARSDPLSLRWIPYSDILISSKAKTLVLLAVLWNQIRLDLHLFGCPGSWSVMGIRIRIQIQEHVNWPNLNINKENFDFKVWRGSVPVRIRIGLAPGIRIRIGANTRYGSTTLLFGPIYFFPIRLALLHKNIKW